MKFQAVYIPIGVGTYHLESAGNAFNKSIEMLKSISDECVYPEKMLLDFNDLKAFLDKVNPNLVIIQNVTFANGAYASEVLKRFSCPVILWTLREPVIDGGRLRLNSLTGAYSAANAIYSFRENFREEARFEYIFGNPDEDRVKREISEMIHAAKTAVELRELKMSAIGHTPQGFGFGRALDVELLKNFGVTLEAIEARELMDKAKSYSDEECAGYLEEAKNIVTGLEAMPEKNIKGFAKLYKAYKDYVNENNIGALASRCWPDFFTAYGTPVCMVLSLLNAEGKIASCEADVYGALSMYIGLKLTGKSSFFGDPVSMDENESTITYWHCGMASCNLAREDTGAQVGVHPNRKIGPVMDFGCQSCEKVTIFRIGRKPDGTFRFFIVEGEALDKPKQFCGTSIVVKTKTPSDIIINESIKAGWEPHFAVAYGDIAGELEKLAHILNMEVYRR